MKDKERLDFLGSFLKYGFVQLPINAFIRPIVTIRNWSACQSSFQDPKRAIVQAVKMAGGREVILES